MYKWQISQENFYFGTHSYKLVGLKTNVHIMCSLIPEICKQWTVFNGSKFILSIISGTKLFGDGLLNSIKTCHRVVQSTLGCSCN